ncbi:HEAT repeat domain-containing protein [Streptomyces sp. NPDC059166]|uniref:HEAT repeat domain-containing protein n=1 Tax=Streptomyces sp. NPDC059166 TaxID=3346752 RepID=UPI0036D0B2E8
MITAEQDNGTTRALRALGADDASVRLRAAMAVGSAPDPRYVSTLVERCAVEPEFQVRELLTWALTRHEPSQVVPSLLVELGSERAQARSQSLHTLSKIGDGQAWPAITRELLTDRDDEVARSAWRAAVVLVPEGEERDLVGVLATQLGRGGRAMRLSLSRAVVALGEVAGPALRAATADPDPEVRQHALATERLLSDPEAGFELAVEEAKRIVALGPDGPVG